MRKLGILLVTLVMATLAFSTFACGGGGGGGEATPTPTHTVTPTTSATATPQHTATPGGTETLSDILGHATNFTSAYCEMVTTEPGQAPEIGKIWAKWSATGYKTWMEGPVTEATEIDGETVAVGETAVTLMVQDATTMHWYVYYPAHHKAYDMSYTMPTPVPGATPMPTQPGEQTLGDLDWLTSLNPTILRSEKYDGKDCLVVQYGSMGETVTMWIWKQYGVTVKTETTSSLGTSVIEYRNMSFNNVPDSKFQLPADTQIIQMPGFGGGFWMP